MASERSTIDPEQWRALMTLSDDDLLEVWRVARDACETATSQAVGVDAAAAWATLIEGAAASRFGVGRHFEQFRTRYA